MKQLIVIDNDTQAIAVLVEQGHSMDDYNRIGFLNSIRRPEAVEVQVMRAISALQAGG